MAKSALERYCTKVYDGKITACEKVRRNAERMLEDIAVPYKGWHFDQDVARKHIDFIERFCKIPSGKLGAPFIMELYELAWMESIFGFIDDEGLRRYQEVLINVARKNGKTSWGGAVELDCFINDGEGSPQVYNVANSMDQAKLGYSAASKMVLLSEKLSKHLSKTTGGWYNPHNLGTLKPLASNTGTLDGLDVHFALIDELHAMTDRDIYDLVKQGMAARSQPLLLECTTNGFVRGGIYDAQYEYGAGVLDGSIKDDRFLPWMYELDSREEWTDEKCWIKANPGLGTVKKLSYLRNNVKKAKQDPTFKATVMTKDFNLPENSSAAWLNFDEAVNEETYDFKSMGFKYCIVGFDASDTIDLTSAQALMMRPGDDKIYVKSMYWIPRDTILADIESGRRKERDGVPYQAWIARDLMRTVPGNKIDKRVLLDWLEELKNEYDLYTFAVGFDPWHMDDSTLRELEMYVGNGRVRKVRQGPATLSQPMKQLKADYRANRLVDNHNPINEWCRMNVSVRTDINDNIQPDKKKNNPKNRIDGFMAELDAYITLMDMFDEYQAVC